MQKKSPGKNGFKYRPRFGVIIEVADEQQQQQVYADLSARGYRCKVVAV